MRIVRKSIKTIRDDGCEKFILALYEWTEVHIRRLYERKIINWYRRKKRESVTDPLNIIYVDPENIKYTLCKSEYTDRGGERDVSDELSDLYDMETARFNRRKNIGIVVGGDWDKHVKPFDKKIVYKGLKKRFEQDYDWKETEFVQNYIRRIEHGDNSFNCSSVEEFLYDRLPDVDELYRSIKNEGYRKQTDISNGDVLHEININIGRNGELIFNQVGHHRLSIAKILNLNRVPVLVIVRHEKWQEIREEIRKSNSIHDLSERARRNLHHPDVSKFVSGIK